MYDMHGHSQSSVLLSTFGQVCMWLQLFLCKTLLDKKIYYRVYYLLSGNSLTSLALTSWAESIFFPSVCKNCGNTWNGLVVWFTAGKTAFSGGPFLSMHVNQDTSTYCPTSSATSTFQEKKNMKFHNENT